MFGFLGTPQSEIKNQANGIVSGATRGFESHHGTRFGTNQFGRTFFDYDNSNVTKANQEALLSASLVTYTGRPRTDFPAMASSSNVIYFAMPGTGNVFNVYGKSGSAAIRRFVYTSNAVLSPTTRKIRQELPYYDTRLLSFMSSVNNGGNQAASNNISGTLDLNLEQFPYLQGVRLQESYLNTINVKGNIPNLNFFVLYRMNGLTTLTGKLPANVQTIQLCNIGTVTSINTFISDCVNCEAFFLSTSAGNSYVNSIDATNSLTGALELSHMTQLKELFIPLNSGLTAINLPTGKSDWSWFQINSMSATASSAFSTTVLDDILSSSALRVFVFTGTGKALTKNIGNSEISSSHILFAIQHNAWSGNINITTSKSNLKVFNTGNNTTRGGTQQNSFPTVNITGLTNATYIDLSGSNISDLQLPVNTSCLHLILSGNKLDIITNPNIISQINAMTALTNLALSTNGSSQSGADANQGQNSTNGLGANPDFSNLSNLTVLQATNSKITGNVTLYNGAKLTTLLLHWNTGLTGITNLSAHASTLTQIGVYGCSSLTVDIGSSFTKLFSILLNGTNFTGLDLSGRDTTTKLTLIANSCIGANVTITFPNNSTFAECSNIITVNNSRITTIVNMDKLSYSTSAVTTLNQFHFHSNSLNITFPFGANSFYPNSIQIQNNGMSQTNVDATIMSIHSNRTKWDFYTAAKSLNIAGTNAAASGTYQAPTVAGSPANAKEAIWELINVKGWSITYN